MMKIIRTHWPSENTVELEFLIRWIFHYVGITKKSTSSLFLPYEIFDSYVVLLEITILHLLWLGFSRVNTNLNWGRDKKKLTIFAVHALF